VYFTDPQKVERLREAGLNVINVDSEESDFDDSVDDLCSSSEEERGRPKKRHCDMMRDARTTCIEENPGWVYKNSDSSR
jgi:hypothetical protein